jgi:hypothetical protein
MKKAIWNDPITGVVSVLIPAYQDKLRDPNLTDDEVLSQAIAKGVPVGVPYEVIDDAKPAVHAFLEDRTFRGAWENTSKNLTVNMSKARVIHMDRIRKKRNEELQKLDIPFMMAAERNDQTTMEKITAQKQKLRDIPQTYDLSGFKTPEKLKAAWPKELDERIKDVKKAL